MSGTDPRSVTQWTEARRWFVKSLDDLQIANLAISTAPPLVEPAAYHCQPTAEKLFRDLPVASAIDVPRTHDLEHLTTLLVGPCSELAD
jgi:HEPN domain-containing protein